MTSHYSLYVILLFVKLFGTFVEFISYTFINFMFCYINCLILFLIAAILENKDLTDEIDIKRAVAKGRWWVREIKAVSRMHRYRTLRGRYYAEPTASM
jgi:hypothetical protein